MNIFKIDAIFSHRYDVVNVFKCHALSNFVFKSEISGRTADSENDSVDLNCQIILKLLLFVYSQKMRRYDN